MIKVVICKNHYILNKVWKKTPPAIINIYIIYYHIILLVKLTMKTEIQIKLFTKRAVYCISKYLPGKAESNTEIHMQLMKTYSVCAVVRNFLNGQKKKIEKICRLSAGSSSAMQGYSIEVLNIVTNITRQEIS